MFYYTSDLHLGHGNIIDLAERPFETCAEMDSFIIKRWNSTICDEDTVFVIGDFCFGRKDTYKHYRKQLNGNIIFLEGNHDVSGRNGLNTPIHGIDIFIGGQHIWLTHDPKKARKDYKFNFCGHTHGKYGRFTQIKDNSYIVDLSVELWDYRPVDYVRIYREYSLWLRQRGKNTKNNSSPDITISNI